MYSLKNILFTVVMEVEKISPQNKVVLHRREFCIKSTKNSDRKIEKDWERFFKLPGQKHGNVVNFVKL